LGLWSSFLVTPRRRPVPRPFARRCKESGGRHSAMRVGVPCNAPTGAGRLLPGTYFGASEAKQKPPRGEACRLIPRLGCVIGWGALLIVQDGLRHCSADFQLLFKSA